MEEKICYDNCVKVGWKRVKLGDLIDFVGGGTPDKKNPDYWSGDIKWASVKDIKNKYLHSTQDTITELGLKNSSSQLAKNGELILVTRISPGRCVISKDNIAINQDLKIIKLKADVSTNFMYYFFTAKENEFIKRSSGTTVKGIRLEELRIIEIDFLPLLEQLAIVSKIEQLFSELDNGISNLKLAQGQLKVYRHAVLKKAFEGELTKKWREQQTDLPDAQDLLRQILIEREKAAKTTGKNIKYVKPLIEEELEELPSLPKKWCWVKNEELIHYVTSGSRDWKQFYSEKGAYFIRTQDIKTDSLALEEAAFVDLPEKVEGKRSLVEKDDLLMTITGANVGKVAHINFDISEAYVSQSVALMKYVNKQIVPFLHYYFQTYGFGATFISNLVYGMGRPVLSLENMREVPISLCSLDEQRQIIQEIETRLSVCDKIEQDIEANLEKAEALRQSILKKAFEGKLLNEKELAEVRKAEDWEPAEVLSEKIKVEKAKKDKKLTDYI